METILSNLSMMSTSKVELSKEIVIMSTHALIYDILLSPDEKKAFDSECFVELFSLLKVHSSSSNQQLALCSMQQVVQPFCHFSSFDRISIEFFSG